MRMLSMGPATTLAGRALAGCGADAGLYVLDEAVLAESVLTLQGRVPDLPARAVLREDTLGTRALGSLTESELRSVVAKWDGELEIRPGVEAWEFSHSLTTPLDGRTTMSGTITGRGGGRRRSDAFRVNDEIPASPLPVWWMEEDRALSRGFGLLRLRFRRVEAE